MKTTTLEDMKQEDFDAAAATVVAGLKAYNRRLDVREGTVLRDLLVNPDAAIQGVVAGQIGEVRKATSLKRLLEAQAAGETIDLEDVNAILANFNLTPHAGTPAKGLIKVVVADGTVAYSVAAGAVFATVDGLSFAADEQVIAAAATVSNPGVRRTTELYSGAAGFFFLVPATAVAVGAAGNITQGTSLEPDSRIPSYVMADAYKDFCGGSDMPSLEEIIRSIPSGLSIRGFVNKTAAEGMLRAAFDAGDHPIVAVSTVGYGNAAQRRDKHNVFGVGVGGRIDLYVRNFTDAFTVTQTLIGIRDPAQEGEDSVSYTINVARGTFPGACWIKSVADLDPRRAEDEEDVVGTLAFDAVRTADVAATTHDFDAATADVEAFNTVWQGFRIRVNEVPPDIPENASESGTDGWSDAREFKVTAYCLPQADELQAFVDRDDVRSVSTDVVVRCPIICSVSVNAVVTYNPKQPVDAASARAQIRAYINGLGFVGRLTRSEIVQILKNLGAVSVEMPDADMLTGELHDAAGVRHVLSGDALDLASITDGAVMLTRDTVVFCAEEKNVQIKLTPNV